MRKRILKSLVAATLSLAMVFPTAALAADNTGNLEEATENIETNTGTIEENTVGNTVENNEGTIESNSGTVDVNNGSIEYNQSCGVVTVNETDGTIESNLGTVVNNKGMIIDNSNAYRLSDGSVIAGVINTNEGDVKENNAIILLNKGTVDNNHGTVNNGTNGVVSANYGGTVTGEGTVELNFSNADKVDSTVNVVQQLWQVVCDKIGHLGIFDADPYADKASVFHTINDLYLWDQGSMIIKPLDESRKFNDVKLGNDGAVLEKLEDGSYKMSGITKDVVLMVLFEGETAPRPIVVHPGKDDEKSQDNNNEPAPASPAAIASAAILPTQMPQSVPVAPSEVVTRLAPVINAFAPYGAVDLSGMPVSVYVADTDPEQKKSKVYEAFINNVLATAGIQIDAKETIAAYTGAIACTSANSVMTFRAVPNPGATLYVIFTDPVSGSVTYVLPKVNPDKTISFEVPFANCEFSVVNVYKK